MEQIEEHWRQESRDLVAMVTRLQEENRRLAESLQESRSDSQYSNKQTSTNQLTYYYILILLLYTNLMIIEILCYQYTQFDEIIVCINF